MGVNCATLLADIYGYELERKLMQRFASGILLYKRYIDDLFIVTTTKDVGLQIFQQLNKRHPLIEYTFEGSSRSTIFMDLEIYKATKFYNTHILNTRKYTKPTSSSGYPTLKSFHNAQCVKAWNTVEILRHMKNCKTEAYYRSEILKFV